MPFLHLDGTSSSMKRDEATVSISVQFQDRRERERFIRQTGDRLAVLQPLWLPVPRAIVRKLKEERAGGGFCPVLSRLTSDQAHSGL